MMVAGLAPDDNGTTAGPKILAAQLSAEHRIVGWRRVLWRTTIG